MNRLNRREWLQRSALLLAAAQFSELQTSRPTRAQDAHEELGVGSDASLTGPHPLLQIQAEHPAALKQSLMGVHPRVFLTDAEIDQLRIRARTTHRDLWQRALTNMIAAHEEPAPPPAQTRRAQNTVGLAIGEVAIAYKIEGDPKYLALAIKFMDAAVSYDVWGYAYSKPNVDLGAGHLLYGLSFGYDLLYHDLSEEQRTKYRTKLIQHAKLLYESYIPTAGKVYSYSQNHLFIPAAGLGIAAYALYGEVPEAADWARLVRALYDRVLETYTIDGYYYEGFEYWVFVTPWIVHYLDALAHSTGEDLFDQPGLRNSYKYVAQSMLPDGKNVFDFGDTFSGSLTRTGKSDDIQRTHPGGRLFSNYILLYRFAQRFNSPEALGVAEWLASLGQSSVEDYWSLVWYEPSIKPVPIQQQPLMQYFADHDVVYWRSGWDAKATAFAFKCGPPEGHRTDQLMKKLPDWRLEDGHAHPDAGSFILFARGQYMTGMSGYAGVPMTNQVNSLLIDLHGQANEGSGHNAFYEVPYDRLNKIRIVSIRPADDGVLITGDATAAYDPELGFKSFLRTVKINSKELSISDSIQMTKPHVLSILFHFDGDAQPADLTIDVLEPKDAVKRLEPNFMISAGLPGTVDKGPKVQRGTRLVVSTPEPVATAEFDTILSW